MLKRILRKKTFFGVLFTMALLMAVSISYAVGTDRLEARETGWASDRIEKVANKLNVVDIIYEQNMPAEVREISLNDALDLALKNNPDMELADLSVRKAKVEYDSARKTANRIDPDTVFSGSDPTNTPAAQYQMGLAIWYQPKATEVAYLLAQKYKDLSENKLKLSVETTYYNVLKAQKNLAIKRENLKYFQDQLKIAQTGYKIGTRAKVDVTVAESAVASYQALVVTEENNYRSNVIDLNRLMGLDLDITLKLTSQPSLDKISAEIDVDGTIKDALDNNVSILEYKKKSEVAKVMADVARRFNGPGIPVYSTSEIDAQTAEVSVSKQSALLKAAIKKSYFSLVTLEQSMDWQTKEVEKAKENARVYALKYEAGLATSLDAKKAVIDLEQAEVNLSQSIYQYNTLKSSFKYGIFNTGSGTDASSAAF